MSIKNLKSTIVPPFIECLERIEKQIVQNKGALVHRDSGAYERVLRQCSHIATMSCDYAEGGCLGCKSALDHGTDRDGCNGLTGAPNGCSGLTGMLLLLIIHMHERERARVRKGRAA
jgi:hypothetical protein